MWERLIELSENHRLFPHCFVVFRREVLVVDALRTKFQQLANQIANADMDRSTQFLLPSLRNDFECKHQQVLSLCKTLASLIILGQTNQVIDEIFELILATLVLSL